MRKYLRRALAGASATALAAAALTLGGIAPANAESSTFCPQSGSTRLLTANDGQYKVWLYQVNGEAHVCFSVSNYARGDLLFRTGLTGSLIPSVIPDVDASDCSVYFHLQDPADVEIQYQWNSLLPPLYLCFGAEGTAVGISITGANGTANPSPELWLDYGPTASDYYCQYVLNDNCYYSNPIRVL